MLGFARDGMWDFLGCCRAAATADPVVIQSGDAWPCLSVPGR